MQTQLTLEKFGRHEMSMSEEAKVISVPCPGCGEDTEFRLTELVVKFMPRCPKCRKGIRVDRAWLLVEVARLQHMFRIRGVEIRRGSGTE